MSDLNEKEPKVTKKTLFRDLAKHSAIYGTGEILTRLASFLLIPIYTTYLRPADYGVIAMLDLAAGLLGTLIVAGIVTAVNRFHFETKSEKGGRQVWWTGITFVLLVASILVSIGSILHNHLARLLLGPNISEGGVYVLLILATFWFGALGQLPALHLRVLKQSSVFLGFSLGRLFLNVGLNVFFLAVWDLGVMGVLAGNLIAASAYSLGLMIIFFRRLGGYVFDISLGQTLWRFGAPMILTGLLSVVMHQANRYVLKGFLNLEEVGLFSLAYTVGQGINSLFLIPFELIWGVVIYEIAQRPDAKQIYVRVFEYWAYGLGVVLLGISLMARPLLQIMVAPDYLPATKFVPIICLAFWFFSLHSHFRIPVLLTKRTTVLIPVASVSALIAIIANLCLIPFFGGFGAAWASVCTFFVFSFGGLWRYRRIDRYPYPLKKIVFVAIGLIASYLGHWWLVEQWPSFPKLLFSAGVVIWLTWVVGLFGWPLWREVRKSELSVFMEKFTSAIKS